MLSQDGRAVFFDRKRGAFLRDLQRGNTMEIATQRHDCRKVQKPSRFPPTRRQSAVGFPEESASPAKFALIDAQEALA